MAKFSKWTAACGSVGMDSTTDISINARLACLPTDDDSSCVKLGDVCGSQSNRNKLIDTKLAVYNY